MKIISQVVDTLKDHFYFDEDFYDDFEDKEGQSFPLIVGEIKRFNDFVETLKGYKAEAMGVHHSNGDMRYVKKSINGMEFQVMATTIKGFAVTLKNKDYSISFRANDKAVPNGNPIIKVEYRSHYLVRAGYWYAIQEVDKFVGSIVKYTRKKLSEIHLATDIQGYDFSELDLYRLKTRKRISARYLENNPDVIYNNSKKMATLSIGKGDEMLRIYDKTLEIRKNPDKSYIKALRWDLSDDYDPALPVWRIEVQYRRETLKTMESEHGLLDDYEAALNSIPSLWKKVIQSFDFKDFSLQEAIEISSGYKAVAKIGEDGNPFIDFEPLSSEAIKKRYQRADTLEAWENLSEWNGHKGQHIDRFKNPASSSFQWVSNSVKSLLNTMVKHYGAASPDLFVKSILKTNEITVKDKGFGIVDDAFIKALKWSGMVEQVSSSYGTEIPMSDVLQDNLELYSRMALTRSLGEYVLPKNVVNSIEKECEALGIRLQISEMVEDYVAANVLEYEPLETRFIDHYEEVI